MGKDHVLFSSNDDPESSIIFDAPKIKARTNIGDSRFELSRNLSNKDTEARINRDFGPFELTGKVSKNKAASLRADSNRAFIEASRDPYNRALSAGYSDGNFGASMQRSFPNEGGRPENRFDLNYKASFADGGPAQQVTQFNPMYYPAQQGIGSLQQEPTTPAMEGSPQNYFAAPTQQYGATSYSAPAANPMTAGLGSYMEGLKYKSSTPRVYTVGAVGAPDDTTSPFIYDPVTQTYKPNPRYVAPVASAAAINTRRVDTTGGSGSGGGSPGGGGGGGSGAAAVSAAEADSAQFGIATPAADAAAAAAAAATDAAQFGIATPDAVANAAAAADSTQFGIATPDAVAAGIGAAGAIACDAAAAGAVGGIT